MSDLHHHHKSSFRPMAFRILGIGGLVLVVIVLIRTIIMREESHSLGTNTLFLGVATILYLLLTMGMVSFLDSNSDK
jgi:hypothetical protein